MYVINDQLWNILAYRSAQYECQLLDQIRITF